MKLKKLALLLLLISQVTVGQDLNSLKIEAQKVYEATTILDFDQIIEGTYPKVFEIISKEQMKQLLISTFNGNDEMKIKLLNVAPDFKFGEIKKIDMQTFCLIDHNLSMELTLQEKIEDDEEAEMMLEIFKAGMETDEVTFNKETNTFTITKISTMIGIADKATNNKWKFLNKDKENVLATKLFSKKVLKELGM